MILNAKHFWTRWTGNLRSWFTEKFNSVISHIPTDYARRSDITPLAKSSELTPLAKSSELTPLAKEAAATRNKEDVIRAIGAIPQPIIPTDYAKEATLSGGITRLRKDISALRGGTATVEQVKNIVSALTNGLTVQDKVWLQHQFAGIDLSSITNILNNNTYGLQALKALIDAKVIPADYAKEQTLQGVSDKVGTFTDPTETVAHKLENLNIDTSTLATKANQQKMMVNFGMAEGEPQLQALTDTEIINQYNGYDSEGEHIEGIADQTYGHLVPAQVTIDDEPFTFYQERTYADYGYSVLYRNGVAIDTTTTHPQEDDELTTTI